MNKEKLTEALNLTFEGMLFGEELKAMAQTKIEKNIADAMYEAFWCLFTVLIEFRKIGDKK